MKGKKILLIGSFSKGAIEYQFVRILESLGWEVSTYDLRARFNSRRRGVLDKIYFRLAAKPFLMPINQELLISLDSSFYDVILVFKGMELLPTTVDQLKSHTSLLVNYNPDHPIKMYNRGSGNDFVRDSIRSYDVYSSYAKRICNDLEKDYQVSTYHLPFGYDDSIKFKSNPTLDYLKDKFIFIGAFDKVREEKLKQIGSPSLKIFGGKEWAEKSHSTYIKECFTGSPLYNEDYYAAQGQALGSINFLRQQNLVERSHNMRTFEVPFAGGMLISDRTDEQLEFFEEDREAIYFSSIDELKSKLVFYQGKPALAKEIGQRGRKRSISSDYSYSRRIKEFSNFLLGKI